MEYKVNEIIAQKALCETSIDIAEYVINPYRGCSMGCIYCYVKDNKQMKGKEWGKQVDIKVNIVELLEKELKIRRPKRVLLGSTTELFQPVEQKYRITEKILKVLNDNEIEYFIMTRQPTISYLTESLSLSLCKGIYFTINKYHNNIGEFLEKNTSDSEIRIDTINSLRVKGFNVFPYICPVIPYLTNYKWLFDKLKNFEMIFFESYNFKLVSFDDFLSIICNVDNSIGKKFKKMKNDEKYFEKIWNEEKDTIISSNVDNKDLQIYFHRYEEYFENKYTATQS
jgi:DNA repair photolyase